MILPFPVAVQLSAHAFWLQPRATLAGPPAHPCRAVISRAVNETLSNQRDQTVIASTDVRQSGTPPTARRRARPQRSLLSGHLRSANPLILKAPNAPNAPNAKMQGDSFLEGRCWDRATSGGVISAGVALIGFVINKKSAIGAARSQR